MSSMRFALGLVAAVPVLWASQAWACQPVCARWVDVEVVFTDAWTPDAGDPAADAGDPAADAGDTFADAGNSQRSELLDSGVSADAGLPPPPRRVRRCAEYRYYDERGCSSAAGAPAVAIAVACLLRRRRMRSR